MVELKQALADKELAVHEMHHRVRNNLQIVSALIAIEHSENMENSARGALQRLRGRVNALLAVHRRIHTGSSLRTFCLREFLEDFLPELGSSLSRRGDAIDVCIDAEPMRVSNDHAAPLALALNEAISGFLVALSGAAETRRLEVKVRGLGDKISFAAPVPLAGTAAACGTWSENIDIRLLHALVQQIRGAKLVRLEETPGSVEMHIPANEACIAR